MMNIGPEGLHLFHKDALALETNHENYTTIQTAFILFPDLHNLLRDNIPSLIRAVNPPRQAEQCPELRYTYHLNNTWWWMEWDDDSIVESSMIGGITKITLRNPTLMAMQLFGVLIGVGGALWLLLLHRSKKTENISTKNTQASMIHKEQWKNTFYWPAAFFWFGMMNATSFFAHSIFEPYTSSHKLWLKFDVMCTGLSCLSLALGSICALWPRACGILSVRHVSAAINICLVSIMTKIGLNSWPWQGETLYLLTLLIAAGLMALLFLSRLRQPSVEFQEKKLMLSAIFSGCIFPLGAFMDIGSCLLFGDSRLSTMTVAFFGCDVALFFILWWIHVVRSAAASGC
uniref:Transmembrane protein n=1 Tax=Helicotheca tamesis TaxID=374047 RepID=A0A6U0HIJ2_9STRA|mmetsp:Transcript_7256/g.9859  ORF Transcript_7256/g.9859 Transcript_7256/m.9859 type:complete len:345 (+) Transcript_7256:130-1164(+)